MTDQPGAVDPDGNAQQGNRVKEYVTNH
jgi:hypothetical protein